MAICSSVSCLARFARGSPKKALTRLEMAPAAAHRDVYLDERGNLKEGEGSSTLGYRASGVPGTVAGMELALKKYGSGRLTWAQLIEPARRLAFEPGERLPGRVGVKGRKTAGVPGVQRLQQIKRLAAAYFA